MTEPQSPSEVPPMLAPAPWKGWLAFLASLLLVALLALMISSVLERRREAAQLPQLFTPVDDLEADNSRWGENFPRQYQSWLNTAESGAPTKHGGPQPFSHLERHPALKELFNGYPFAVEYNDDRGHMHALDDVRATARIDPARGGKPQPGTCLTCKSSDVPRLMRSMGVQEFYAAPFAQVSAQAKHPVGCADCHDSRTMNLRLSRPALREAFAAMGRDIDKTSYQEMRSLVCAQCHVEYYFAKSDPAQAKATYLTFPWKRGTSVEAMDEFYTNDLRHVDWVHPVSKTEMVKMQHPDYELFLSGVHAYRGVACADCHMPYRSEGGVKFTDHHIQSPLKNVSNSCTVCHRWSEAEIVSRVEAIQDSTNELLHRAERALAAAHREIGAAMRDGATDAQLADARETLRRAQLRWDYVAAGNGMGFHAPQESARILATAIDLAQEARLAVARHKAER